MLKVKLKYDDNEHDGRAVNGTLAEHKVTTLKTKKKSFKYVSVCIFRTIEEVWKVLAELNYICYEPVIVLKIKQIGRVEGEI